MENITRAEFEQMKQHASERIMQMQKNRMPPFPDFVTIPQKPTAHPNSSQNEQPSQKEKPSAREGQPSKRFSSLIKYINLPELTQNSDGLLLLALILLLSHEEADETLILSLAYILL